MTDIILKIYSTTTTWGDTLDHTIFGDVIDHRITDNSNYLIDTAWFKINDVDHKWSDQITPDHWTGSAESTQIWRAFSRGDDLIGSGIITKVYKSGGFIYIEGEGMSSLLKRRIIDNEFFHTKKNDGTAFTGEDMLLYTSTTDYGLIKKYLGTTYGALTVTAVDTPTSTEARVWKFDGASLWDACVDIARGSYGSNGNSFDMYLYETYSSPSTFARAVYFKEIESTVKAKTIALSDIHIPSFDMAEHSRQNYNRVICRGEINPHATYPKDIKYHSAVSMYILLTHSVHDGGNNKSTYAEDSSGDFVNDGVVAGMYLTNISDGCAGEITGVTATRITCSGGFRAGTDQHFDDGDLFQVGYAYASSDGAGAFSDPCIYYTTTNPYAGIRSLVFHRNVATHDAMFTISNFNDNIDSRYHHLRFWVMAKHKEDSDDSLPMWIHLGVKDRYGNKNEDGYDLTDDSARTDAPHYKWSLQAYASSTSWDSMQYTWMDIPLPKHNNDGGWSGVGATDLFDTSGIQQDEWHRIYQVGFWMDDGAGEDIEYLVINGMHFVGNVPYTGSYPSSGIPTYRREYIHQDRGLKSDTDCDNMAQNLLNGINQKQWAGSLTLMGLKRDFSLKAGNTVEVVVPVKGINVQSGQTPAKLGIQRIIHTPNRQTLEVGRNYSLEEIVNNIARRTRLSVKTD